MAELICLLCENILRNNDNNIFQTNSKDVFSIFDKYTIKHDNRSWLIDFLASNTFISNFYPDVEYLIRVKNLTLNDALLAVMWVATKREWNLFNAKCIKNQLIILNETLMKISFKNRPETTYDFDDRICDVEDYLNFLLTIIDDYRTPNFDDYILQCTEEWTNRFKIIKSSKLGTYENITNLLPNIEYVKVYDFYNSEYVLKPYKINLLENFKLNYRPNSLYDIIIKKCVSEINLDKLIGIVPTSVIFTLKNRDDIEKIIK